jgi:hypothetical protein
MKLDKTKSILQKDPKQKKKIKTMMIKIKIKNKLESNFEFFIEW